MNNSRFNGPILAVALCLSGVASSGAFAANVQCADQTDKTRITQYLKTVEAGAPLPVLARDMSILETRIASGLPAGQSVGTVATDETITTVWKTIEKWGRSTRVWLVFSINGTHTFNFPSTVPMRQADDGDGFHDVYADGNTGVHAHLLRPEISSIFAAKLPSAEDGIFARSVNFYDDNGGLIIGIYASMADGKGEPAGITGFADTWDAIAEMPQVCSG
ncbi:MAG: hypothetical protein JKY57_03295 [Kordiimonadaceae bacterium]|nr:hypothetical protein [Kordiimonadaceae bacterium]